MFDPVISRTIISEVKSLITKGGSLKPVYTIDGVTRMCGRIALIFLNEDKNTFSSKKPN